MEARRYGGPAAMAAGLVDGVGGLEAALGLVRERGLAKKAATGIYGLMKAEMYRESVALLGREGHEEGEVRDRVLVEGEERRRGEGERRVAELKAKL
ncbi:hypothetical protein CHGG_08228 [Chaetomium globosum CBS 148.51]|uniref:Uncharacterized protein n=1 Tax=Chaetomium globosum (strain ATCC 6205 / CBS 148.51 / DSM 1962 / NBRC 6347 / NRRL 1970) TaxID=306901 RepID=Q2GUX6_CHAGB|nr:uncharacterized protein CHGG_08228 [Chaetomium globosum CBS 148.51]EAQ86975.1 hypothetical protein CHGG_08228 [Chaetomium globosum CBS 148.51]